MAEQPNTPRKLLPADRTRAIRLDLIRKLEKGIEQLTQPGFSGKATLEFSSVNGVLGDKPWLVVAQCGLE